MNKKAELIEKNVFLQSSTTLIIGFAELGSRKLVDSVIRRGVKEIQSLPKSIKEILRLHNATGISTMTDGAFKIITSHLDESYITLSYSWLETYLFIVEEALYLHDPRSLGDNIQIKLGKILETDSVAELVHDAVKKRLKEKSSWGLKNRIADLKDIYKLNIPQDNKILEYISRTRNDLVHDKNPGEFTVTAGKVKYTNRRKNQETIDTNDYLDKVFNLTIDLFSETSRKLKIDRRSATYRSLEDACEKFRHVFKKS